MTITWPVAGASPRHRKGLPTAGLLDFVLVAKYADPLRSGARTGCSLAR